jgi:hypothetical protein
MVTHERRTSPRVRAYRPVRLNVPATHRLTETLTKDLGTGGLCCISSTIFPIATELHVELTLSEGGEPVAAKGKAVWFRMIPHSEQVDMGIAFLEMSMDHKRRLSAYLDRLSTHTHTFQP